ncbi:polyprenyl synthetase family protein [Oceanobacillus sp. FSL H7-0719]|uniref:polyprenyl synthetase family protein n=1 Tax=Oceanobacillus sp. FSL H7-0719 TaxID=2954507 RepID=UPI003255671B
MQQDLRDYLISYKTKIEKEIAERLGKLEIPENLKESMLYSMQAGGKRIRPILLIASFEAYGTEVEKAISSAVALEMIHTYSLIHDDLPAMDDDDYRRGQLTNHKKFGEATAILAGDALLTNSFEQIAADSMLSSVEKAELITKLAQVSGPLGMVAGQILDMEAEKRSVSLEELERIHELKTGELLRFAVYAGAYLARATEEQLKHLVEFAHYLGLIFQVQDDILDITGTEEKLGKPVGSDESNEKSTYPKLLGLDGAMKQKEIYVENAKQALSKANAANSTLELLVDYFSNRDH